MRTSDMSGPEFEVSRFGGIDSMPVRTLGASGPVVSLLSLGSWRTFERLDRDVAAAVMAQARDVGINCFDDARYNDETGTAPLASGWSEVVFGELFRRTFARRDDAVVSNKLWWEFWPEQDAPDELDASLGRMQFDHVDLIYSLPPPADLGVDGAVAAIGGLLGSGRARHWGIANWPADQAAHAVRAADEQGIARPCAAQLPYSLVQHQWVEGDVMAGVLDSGVGLVASYSLAGGTLSGKYLRGETGRVAASDDNPVLVAGKALAASLAALADEWGVTPAALAIAFALDHPRLATVLFGATSPAQIDDNVRALDVHAALDGAQRARLRSLAREAS